MKVFLFIFILLFPKVIYAEWINLYDTLEGHKFYYNSETVKRNGNFIFYHQMIDLFKPMKINDEYFLSMKSYLKINCTNFDVQPHSVKAFDEPLGEGNMVLKEFHSNAEWEKQGPNSTDVAINKYLCKNY